MFPTTVIRVLGSIVAFTLLSACEDTAKPTAISPPVAATAVRLVFDQSVEHVVCNGRSFDCRRSADTCTVDISAADEHWPSEVVVCQGVQTDALFAPLIPLVFKDGLPIWTPNLDAAGQVHATPASTAVAVAFLSPYLTAMYPETARALLAQTALSPYLPALTTAVVSRDEGAISAALAPVITDVLSQATVQQALRSGSVGMGMDHIEVEQLSDYVTIESRLGTSVDHICVIYAMDACVPGTEADFATARRVDVYPKHEIGQVFVPSNSYFSLGGLARAALSELFGDLLPEAELETVRLEPGRVHDIQCYSGALGALDEAEAQADGVLISQEPDARYFVRFARVANLISLSIDTLRLFVDFGAFGDKDLIAKAVSICTGQALGEALELTDGTTREEWLNLIKVIQGCAVKQLGAAAGKRGVHALATWIFDFAEGGGSGIVGKVSRAGMVLDRVVGMLIMSPVQRMLLANEVDFDACIPCEDDCPAEGGRRCIAGGATQVCWRGEAARPGAEACLAWQPGNTCDDTEVCVDAGECVACGGAAEACCGDGSCDANYGCVMGQCTQGCRDECFPEGNTECVGDDRQRTCGEFDGDACLEWGPATACDAGDVCEVGACGLPSCVNECDVGAERCVEEGEGIESCGQCDADICSEWCEPMACEAHFSCADASCQCASVAHDLPGVAPGVEGPDLDDGGGAWVSEDALWPEGDVDIIYAHIDDALGNSFLPRAEVTDVGAGLTYDLCIAYACDPEENSGEVGSVDCGGAVRTTRDGMPACCRLSQVGPSFVEMEVDCGFGGFRDDSGWATVYLESVRGEQCWPAARVVLTGGTD